jgi:hypothetical protein
MLLWFELALCNDARPIVRFIHEDRRFLVAVLDLGVANYVDAKEGDAVAVVAAVGDVRHLLDDAAVGENVPLQIIQTRLRKFRE